MLEIEGAAPPLLPFADQLYCRVDLDADPDYDEDDERRTITSDIEGASLITSYMADFSMRHRPIIDVDLPCALLPSSTPGHFHLYIDKPMDWPAYVKLLEALAEAGIVEQGYVAASLERGHTAVRLPWVRKPVSRSSPPLDAVPDAW